MLNSLLSTAQVSSISNDPPQIMEVKSFLASLKNSEQFSKSTNSNSVQIEHLLKNVQQAVYVSSKGIKSYGDQPNSLFVNSNSLSYVKNSSININDIEIVTIKINSKSDLNSTIDLSVFSNYPKLKYIYIISTVQTDENSLKQMIKNNNTQFSVFYKIENES